MWVGAEGKGQNAISWSFARACQLKCCPCRIVSAFRNKFEENSGNLIPKYGNLTFKQVNMDRLTDWRTDSVTKSSIWYVELKMKIFSLPRWSLIRVSNMSKWISVKWIITGDHTTFPPVASVMFPSTVNINQGHSGHKPREAFIKFASVKVWT